MISRRHLLSFGAAVLGTGLLSACAGTTEPIAPTNPIAGLTLPEIRTCLIKAGSLRGWTVLPMPQENHLQATYIKGHHICILDIFYSEDKFTIRLNPQTSDSLLEDDGTVHRNVNRWINNYRSDAQQLMTELCIKKMEGKVS